MINANAHSSPDILQHGPRTPASSRATPMGRSQPPSMDDIRSQLSSARKSLHSGALGGSAFSGSLGRLQTKRPGRAPIMTLEQMQEHVHEQAMKRHLEEATKEAHEAVVDHHYWKEKHVHQLREEKDEHHHRRKNNRVNQDHVRSQIGTNKVAVKEARSTWIEAASSHSFPVFAEYCIPEQEVKDFFQSQRALLKTELDGQVLMNNTLRHIEEKKERDWAAARVTENRQVMARQRYEERERFKKLNADAVDHWDHEVELKRMKKQILASTKAQERRDVPPSRGPGARSTSSCSLGPRPESP